MKKNQVKYFIVDLYAHASEHSLINESFIQYFEQNKDSKFLINHDHTNFLKNKKNAFNYPIKDSSIKNRILRLINREIIKLFTFLFFVPYAILSKRKICILGASNIQMYFLSLLSFLNPKIVVHGQAESLLKPTSFPAKLFFKAYNRFNNKKINLLFLSYHIKDNIKHYDNQYFIKHPLPDNPDFKFCQSQNNTDAIYRIAIVGLIRNDKKNCNLIYDLKVKDNIELWVIGRAHSDFKVKKNSKVNFKLWNEIYSTEEFNEEIKKIDGFLYLFDENQYKLTASATALDALIYNKTVFTLNNPAIISLLGNYKNIVTANTLRELEKGINDFVDSHNFDNHDFDDAHFSEYNLNNPKNPDIITLEKWLN